MQVMTRIYWQSYAALLPGSHIAIIRTNKYIKHDDNNNAIQTSKHSNHKKIYL